MLLELTIQNIALIESLRLEFAQGFNVLTGETGAGKSIVVDSINLALGGRADRDMIRTGAEKGMNDRFARILTDSIVSVEPVNNLIVVNPLTASANAAGEAIDSMKWSEVMGTIAGDNTLLIITRSSEAAEILMGKFNTMLND